MKKTSEIELYVFWTIRNVNWSDSYALFDANMKIAFRSSDLIRFDHSNESEFKLNRISISSLVFSMFDELEYIALINALHLSSNSILILSLYWIDERFFIRLFLVNLYAWETSFSTAVFKKFNQNFFFAERIAWK
jgi:hypothetical protein